MAIDVETKDCAALSDAEIEVMADLCATGGLGFEIGELSKQAQSWVLVTRAAEGGKLRGFAFCTLERIGGTPSVLIGMAMVARGSKRDQVLRGLVTDQMRRAVLAFPDEDVLIATQIADAAAYDVLKGLNDTIPRPGHRANGEERAWGRRLAKRFGIETDAYDDRRFVGRVDGRPSVYDHESAKPEKLNAGLVEMVNDVEACHGESLIVHGWAMAEELARLAP